MIDPTGLLMIEPVSAVSHEPVIDEYTRKMAAAWRQAEKSEDGYRGVHGCVCGTTSDNHDYWVVDGTGSRRLTNSLCVHYLAFHRQDVPQAELDKVAALPYGEEEPTEEELRRSGFSPERPKVYR